MATITHVKAKSNWKEVDISSFLGPKANFDEIISFQELTNYDMVDKSNKKGKKVRHIDV